MRERDLLYLKCRVSHTHTHIFYLLVYLPNGHTTVGIEPGQNKEPVILIEVSQVGNRGPSTSAFLGCFLRHIGRELDWEQSNWGLNQHSNMG